MSSAAVHWLGVLSRSGSTWKPRTARDIHSVGKDRSPESWRRSHEVPNSLTRPISHPHILTSSHPHILTSSDSQILKSDVVSLLMSDFAIEFRDVSLTRPGAARALDHFSLGVESGEVLALVGRSGAGKTTVIKLVNRLLVPDGGAVLVEGRDTSEWDPIALRRRVGYVLQDIGLFPHMTVADNVAVVPGLERWTVERTAARVLELLELVGLPPPQFAARWPDELSGGHRHAAGVGARR